MHWQRINERQQQNARKSARINGRIMLYGLTAVILIGPAIAPDGALWHYLIAVPLAIANVLWSRWLIRWGSKG